MCDVAKKPKQSREVVLLNETNSQGEFLPASLGLFIFVVKWYADRQGLRQRLG